MGTKTGSEYEIRKKKYSEAEIWPSFGSCTKRRKYGGKSRTIFFLLKKINDFFFKNQYQQLLWEERQVQNVKLEKRIFRSRDMAIFGQLHQEEKIWGEILVFSLKKKYIELWV